MQGADKEEAEIKNKAFERFLEPRIKSSPWGRMYSSPLPARRPNRGAMAPFDAIEYVMGGGGRISAYTTIPLCCLARQREKAELPGFDEQLTFISEKGDQ